MSYKVCVRTHYCRSVKICVYIYIYIFFLIRFPLASALRAVDVTPESEYVASGLIRQEKIENCKSVAPMVTPCFRNMQTRSPLV